MSETVATPELIAQALARLPDRQTSDGSIGPRRAVGAMLQPTLAELSRPGRGGGKIPHPPVDALDGVPASQRRSEPLAASSAAVAMYVK